MLAVIDEQIVPEVRHGQQVATARGDEVDFDTIVIKQQLAQAPMNIEVARRKEFIDSKEGKGRTSQVTTDSAQLSNVYSASNEPTRVVSSEPTPAVATVLQIAGDFEINETPLASGRVESPVADIPRKRN